MDEQKKQRWIDRMRFKYRLIVYNDSTFQDVGTYNLSRMNLFALFALGLMLMFGLSFVLLAYTPLNRILPYSSDEDTKREIVQTALRLDSLEYAMQVQELYYRNLRNVIEGKPIEDLTAARDTTVRYDDIAFTLSPADSLLRLQVETEEQYNLTNVNTNQDKKDFSSLHFFPPLNKGLVVNSFNAHEQHFGVDIVAEANEGIMAVLDGTVISATWTLSTGYVISVQHEHDLISAYKHNSALLKKVGDNVRSGEVIAIIGNTGELTTGPHLHFELWHKGVPLDPENYIIF